MPEILTRKFIEAAETGRLSKQDLELLWEKYDEVVFIVIYM